MGHSPEDVGGGGLHVAPRRRARGDDRGAQPRRHQNEHTDAEREAPDLDRSGRSQRAHQEVEDRTARAEKGEAPEQSDLRAELVRLRRHQQGARHCDEEREHNPTPPARGHRLGVGEHEEEEDQDLG